MYVSPTAGFKVVFGKVAAFSSSLILITNFFVALSKEDISKLYPANTPD